MPVTGGSPWRPEEPEPDPRRGWWVFFIAPVVLVIVLAVALLMR
jgi:hypothetical protein